MNLSLKHVRIEAHNLMHVKGLKRHYKASMQNMQGVLKPTWYKVIIWQYEHKIQPWHNQPNNQTWGSLKRQNKSFSRTTRRGGDPLLLGTSRHPLHHWNLEGFQWWRWCLAVSKREGPPPLLVVLERDYFWSLKEVFVQVCVEHAMAVFYAYIAML